MANEMCRKGILILIVIFLQLFAHVVGSKVLPDYRSRSIQLSRVSRPVRPQPQQPPASQPRLPHHKPPHEPPANPPPSADPISEVGRVEKLLHINQTLQILYEKRSQQCGSLFSANFTKPFLEKRSKGWKNQRSLISVSAETGISDRIVGTVSNFLISLLTDRYFVYSARGDATHPDVLSESFNFPYIEAVKSPPIAIRESGYWNNYSYSYTEGNRSYHLYNYMLYFELVLGIRGGVMDIHKLAPDNFDTVILISHLGFTMGIYNHSSYKTRLSELGLTPYTTFGCLFDFLFQPKPEIFLSSHYFHAFQLLTNQFYLSPSNSSASFLEHRGKILKIGIHLRVGDRVLRGETLGNQVRSYEGIFECAHQIEAFVLKKGEYSRALWYLISDSKEFRRHALEKYGSAKILTTIPSHLSHTGHVNPPMHTLHAAAAEWWLYSLTDYRVISSFGGFAVSASSRLPFDKLTYRVDAQHAKQMIHCGEDDYRRESDMASELPGI